MAISEKPRLRLGNDGPTTKRQRSRLSASMTRATTSRSTSFRFFLAVSQGGGGETVDVAHA
jgi:hypothetical protein